ncbi:MAG: alkaline phosphatase family protein [Opitutaceae bacterium]
MQRFLLPLFLALAVVATAGAADNPSGRHVVVVVWDGMRPDFISEQTTPHLWALAQSGVFFASHHPVYLSATEVNGTAIATGQYPAHSFVIANTDYRPRIDPDGAVGIENPAVVRKGDEVSGGHYLGAPTVAEILHARGLATVIAGSKQVALLHDRARRPNDPGVSPVLYQGAALPPGLEFGLTQALGDFPPAARPDDKTARDAWTTRALTGQLWKNGVPPYSLLWLAEPDSTQHATGPGSAASLAAIRSSDDNLGRVLAELDRRGQRTTTDVLVVSDHGFSTINRKIDVAAALAAAGFDARRNVPGGLKSGEVMTVSDGGTTLLYVGDHDAGLCRRLAVYLQTQDWTGVIFSRTPLEGTFPLAAAHLDAPEAPDLVVSLRWAHDRSTTGTPGLIASDLKPSSEKIGNHASLSCYDMHNTLVAAGPDFRTGVRDTLPSANTDLAPTILWILGLKDEAAKMDGRVLGEALADSAPPLRSFELKHLTARRDLGDGRIWEQYLNVSEVNGVQYFDEGNGAQVPAR